MKHIPNFLTICNLICGCIAITLILSAPMSLETVTGEEYFPKLGINEIYIGAIFILIAALFDVFDGLAARLLNAHSKIGKDLDSLADVVSFGIAPSVIMFQLIWRAYMSEPGALDTPMVLMLPAFAIAAFAALRLAKFNQTSDEQKNHFIGMPVPANGIIIATLALSGMYVVSINELLLNRFVLYGIITLLCFLMVSKIKFLKWKPAENTLKAWLPQIVILLVAVIGFPILNIASVLLAFGVYIVFSIFNRK